MDSQRAKAHLLPTRLRFLYSLVVLALALLVIELTEGAVEVALLFATMLLVVSVSVGVGWEGSTLERQQRSLVFLAVRLGWMASVIVASFAIFTLVIGSLFSATVAGLLAVSIALATLRLQRRGRD